MMFHYHIINIKCFLSLIYWLAVFQHNIIDNGIFNDNNYEQPTNTTCDDKLPSVPLIKNLCRFLLPCYIGEP